MKPRTQGNSIDSCVHRGIHPYLEGFLGAVHREFFHAVNEHGTISLFFLHGLGDKIFLRFRQFFQIEFDRTFV